MGRCFLNVQAEAVRLLLAKAIQDELAACKLADDPEVGDEIIGFHLQQAAEKRLKALLTFHGIPYRRTHDVLELLDLLITSGHPVPKTLELLQEMTPFAVEYRYESPDQYEDAPLDRVRALGLVAELEAWVKEQIREIT